MQDIKKDVTMQVHKDAMKYIQSASETQVVLDGNIYKLLLKNISRSDPLTREETQELKAFRDSLTMEQWNGWLQFARNEKILLKKMKGKQKSPSKTMAVLKQSPNELLHALMNKDLAGHSVAEAAQMTDGGPEVSPHQNAHDVIPERLSLVHAPFVSWDSNVSEPAASRSADEHCQTHWHSASLDATSDVEFAPSVTSVESANGAGNAQQPQQPQLQQPTPSASLHEYSEVPLGPSVTKSTVAAPTVEARAAAQAVHTPAPVLPLPRGLDSDVDVGVSLDRGMLGRGRGGGGGKHRPASAPRERPQARSAHTIDSNHAHFGPSIGSYAGSNPSPSVSFRGRSSDDQGGYARVHPHQPIPTHSPRQRPAQDGMFSSHSHSHTSHVAFSSQEPPPASHATSTNRLRDMAQHHSNSVSTEDRRRHNQRERSALDLADAAEIARSTAFRLDSAYSAAQCLLGSFATDQSLSAQFHNGTPMASAAHAVEPSDSQKMQATLAILTEMMSSMEKSREALEHLSSMHLAGSTPAHSLRRSPEHGNSAASAYRMRSGRISGHSAASTTGSNASALSHQNRDNSVSPEGPFGASADTDQGISPLDTAMRFRGFDEHPHSTGDSQVLSFEDLSNTNRVFSPVHVSKPSNSTEPDLTPFGSLRNRGDLAWYPNNSLNSGGAKLNAAHMQEKAHDDFNEWNRQLSASANVQADKSIPFDAKASLQSQLFDAADTARRTNVYNSTLALTPQGGKSQQFQYSSGGYVWEGVRYARAQGPVARLCYASGPLLKAQDDYPVRVDAERRTADVVWRELKLGAGGPAGTEGSQTATRGTVLRRERFAFDDVFVGQSAEGRLSFFARQRARKALECGHNLAVLSLACGDADAQDQSGVEPPVSLLLGSGGGTGLISSTIDEIFRFVKPLTMSMQDSHHLYPGGLPTSSPSAFVASKVAFEQVKSRVTMSAIILSETGAVYDLLSTSAGPAAVGGSAHLKRRKSDGRVTLCDVSRLQLQATADFDRVMGLLLGKRTALQSVLQTFQMQHAQQQRLGVHVQNDPMQSVLASIDPWASFSSKGRRAGDALQNGAGTGACTSSMLISVSVSGGAVSSTQTSVDFHFVSPCGKNWSCPGSDINILAELVSGLPNQPPSSLLRASPLGMLLMDPRNGKTDFVNVVTVHREKENSATNSASAKESAASVVHGALHSLRIIAQITQ